MQQHPIHVFVNKTKYDLEHTTQIGTHLKELAGIPLGDVLFLQRPGEDEVITNDATITLKNGDHLHSQPPADYGLEASTLLARSGLASDLTIIHPQVDGWSFLVISDYPLPEGYMPNRVELLVKLPPGFPDSAPDMFWVNPPVRTSGGSLPRATTTERLLNADWQRFSWHMAAGAWKPGASELRDFLRCIAARFLRLD
jgi:hypothetical protein